MIELLGSHLPEIVGAGLAGLATLVQVAPIKLNPWSWLARTVGHAINGEVIEKVDKLESNLSRLQTSVEERDATDARTRILRFGDECLHGDRHSKEHFDQILRDITDYEAYCRDHPRFKNSTAELTIASIKANYQRLLDTNGFL